MCTITYSVKLLFFILMVGVPILATAQKNEIVVDRSKIDGSPSTLRFKDDSGRTIRAIDVESVNPYKNDFLPKNAESMRVNGRNLTRSMTFTHLATETSGFVALSFEYNPIDQDGILMEDLRESTVIVFDDDGNQIYRLDHLPFDAQRPLVGPNGKYLGLYFGEPVHDAITEDIGFKIYDIAANKAAYEINAKSIGGGYVQEKLMIFRVAVDRNHSTYYVFNSDTGVLYERTFNMSEMRLLKRFEENGVVFVLPPDAERTEEYSKHFKVVQK